MLADALEVTLVGLFLSPDFLFHSEIGSADPKGSFSRPVKLPTPWH
jgi:hypothetical protein